MRGEGKKKKKKSKTGNDLSASKMGNDLAAGQSSSSLLISFSFLMYSIVLTLDKILIIEIIIGNLLWSF